jgi:hypothetical protein
MSMGRVCDICGHERPKEQFSGSRRRVSVCKRCRQIPKAKRRFIEAEIQISELFGQTHISDRNASMLNSFAASPNPQIAELATCVLDVVLPALKLKRRKGKKSTPFTREMCKEICTRREKAGLILDDDLDIMGEDNSPADLQEDVCFLDDVPF